MRTAMPAPMRLFLIWCLALLLPLQGLAASAGLHCVAMAVVPADTATPTQTGAAAHPCHGTTEAAGRAESHHAAAATSDHLALPGPADELAAAGHTCSACATCCVAAALPSHSRWTAAPVLAEAMPALPLPHSAGITSAGLDRPPKTFIV